MRVLVLLVAVILLSGCVDEGSPDAADKPLNESEAIGPASSGEVVVVTPEPVFVAEPLHWNGTLGTFAFACEYENTGACQGHIVQDGSNSIFIDGPFRLDAADITLTWTSTVPVNDELHFEIMTMGPDAGNEQLKSIVGRSPLNIQLAGLDLNLTVNDQIHIFAYNPRGLVHQPPVILHASFEQAISVSGSLTRADAPAAE